MKKLTLVIIGIAVLIGIYLLYPLVNVQQADETSPLEAQTQHESTQETPITETTAIPQATLLAEGELIAQAHGVQGKALLIDDQGKKILRFENLDTTNGPDLRIYLSSDLGVEDAIDLGPIKATKGNVNYEIDQQVDTAKYHNVLIWCRAFSVLFSYADLK